MSALLRLEGIRVEAGGRSLLSVDELEVRTGELLVVLGPTGAGKSTLLRVLNRLQRPDAGTFRWRGEAVPWPAPLALRRRITMAFQVPLLFAGTVADNVAYGLRLRGLPAPEVRERTGELLEMMGLSGLADRRGDRLSGGEAQRAALARALAVRPDLLLLDEPLASLDAPIRERLAGDLQAALRALGTACVFVTHHQREAVALADRLAVLHEGRILQCDTAEAVFHRPATAFVAGFVRTLNLFPGRVEGGRFLGSEGVRLPVQPGAPEGPGQLCIRPEEVRLDLARPDDPGALAVRVEALQDEGGTLRVRLSGALALVALVTRREARDLGLAPGLELWARLPVAALHLIPDRAITETAPPAAP